ncbi:MAG TPA: hypothetical protein VIU61_17830 [Kofleriaceae bacterium]
MRRFLFALVAGASLAACGLYFDDSKQGSGPGPTRPDAPQHPYPDASTEDGGSYPDAGEPCDGGVFPDGNEYPDAGEYPDGAIDAGEPHYPDAH